jgi:hypothetical protein
MLKISIATLIYCLIVTLPYCHFLLYFPYYVGQEISVANIFIILYNRKWSLFSKDESLFLFVWIIGSVISITASFYSNYLLTPMYLKLDDNKPLIISICYYIMY